MVNRENQSLSKNDVNNISIVIDSGNSSSTIPNNDDPVIIVESASEKYEQNNDGAWNQFVIYIYI